MPDLQITITGKDAASAVMQGIAGHAQGMGSAIGNAASSAAGFAISQGLLALPGILYDSAKAAAEDEASVSKLKQAVANTGASWDQYSGSLGKTIDNGIRLGFADSQTRDALSLLTAQTGSAEEAQTRLGMAQDIARGTGMDLFTASKLLGKVTDENVNVFKKYGIEVEKGMGQTELFGLIQEKFGGQAETFAGSSAGMMASFNLQMGEFQEALGAVALPLLTRFASFLTAVIVPAFNVLLVPAFTAVGNAIDGLLGALDPLIMAFSGLFSFLAGDQTLTEFSDGLSELFGNDAADSILSFVQTFQTGFDRVKQIVTDAITTIQQVFANDWLPSDEINPFVNAIGTIATMIRDVVMPAIGDFLQIATTSFAGIAAVVNQALSGDVQGAITSFLSLVGSTTASLVELLASWASAFVDWVLPMVPDLLANLLTVVTAVGEWILGTGLPALTGKLLEWGAALIAWVAPRIPGLLLEMGALNIQLGEWILGTALPAIVANLGQWGLAFLNWVAEKVMPGLPGALNQISTAMVTWLNTTAGQISTGAVEWGTSLIRGFSDGLAGLGSALQGLVSAAVGNINVDIGPFHLSSSGFRVDSPPPITLTTIQETIRRVTGGGEDVPGFALGGLVPGPVGRPMLAVVHGGERVLTPGQQRGGGGGGGMQVTFNGMTHPEAFDQLERMQRRQRILAGGLA